MRIKESPGIRRSSARSPGGGAAIVVAGRAAHLRHAALRFASGGRKHRQQEVFAAMACPIFHPATVRHAGVEGG